MIQGLPNLNKSQEPLNSNKENINLNKMPSNENINLNKMPSNEGLMPETGVEMCARYLINELSTRKYLMPKEKEVLKRLQSMICNL